MNPTENKITPLSSFNRLMEGIRILGMNPDPSQITKLLEYLSVLDDWNQRINLTSIDADSRIEKIIFESAAIMAARPPKLEPLSFADLGTGSGIPGISLAILMPNVRAVLIEIQQKRINFLMTVVHDLKLSNVEIVRERIEEIPRRRPNHLRQYDLIVARALGNMELITNYARPLLSHHGCCILPRGIAIEAEFADFLARFNSTWTGIINTIPIPFATYHSSFVILTPREDR